MTPTRFRINEYWRKQREAVRDARERAKNKTVDPQVFLSNPRLLATVKNWILVAGIKYARQELDNTGVPQDGIDQIIRRLTES